MPRFRFTLRRMMVAVAIVAVLILFVAMKWRRDAYLAKAVFNATLEKLQLDINAKSLEMAATLRKSARLHRELAESIRIYPLTVDGNLLRVPEAHLAKADILEARATTLVQDVEKQAGRMEWLNLLKLKYEYAARHPWLTVAPDPPEPK